MEKNEKIKRVFCCLDFQELIKDKIIKQKLIKERISIYEYKKLKYYMLGKKKMLNCPFCMKFLYNDSIGRF